MWVHDLLVFSAALVKILSIVLEYSIEVSIFWSVDWVTSETPAIVFIFLFYWKNGCLNPFEVAIFQKHWLEKVVLSVNFTQVSGKIYYFTLILASSFILVIYI